jgi:hypothetical protein
MVNFVFALGRISSDSSHRKCMSSFSMIPSFSFKPRLTNSPRQMSPKVKFTNTAFLLFLLGKEIAYWLRYLKSFFNPNTLLVDSSGYPSNFQAVLSKTDYDSVPISNDSALNIGLVTGYGLGSHYSTVEFILGLSLHFAGNKIHSIYCNKALTCCELSINGNSPNMAPLQYRHGISPFALHSRCNSCVSNLNSFYKYTPYHQAPLTDYVTEADYLFARSYTDSFFSVNDIFKANYLGVNVGEEVHASVARSTFTGIIDDSSEMLDICKNYLISSIIAVKSYRRCFAALKLDRVVCIHGVYHVHGLAAKVASSLDIPVTVIGGGGIRKNTFIASQSETYHRSLVTEPNSLWKNLHLTDSQIDKVLEYAQNKRYAGSGVDYLHYHDNPEESHEKIRQFLGVNDNCKIVTLYTNVIWDAQIFYSGNVFSDIVEWLHYSISILSKIPDIHIVIRVHPAEIKGLYPSRQPIISLLTTRYGPLPTHNFSVVRASDSISSYSLCEMSLANIVYGTKAALEFSLMGRPVIICGETFSRNKGFCIDIDSRDHYAEILSDLPKALQSYSSLESRELALKYAYYYYFLRMISLPLADDSRQKKFTVQSFNDLLRLPELKVVVDGIVSGAPIVLPSHSV